MSGDDNPRVLRMGNNLAQMVGMAVLVLTLGVTVWFLFRYNSLADEAQVLATSGPSVSPTTMDGEKTSTSTTDGQKTTTSSTTTSTSSMTSTTTSPSTTTTALPTVDLTLSEETGVLVVLPEDITVDYGTPIRFSNTTDRDCVFQPEADARRVLPPLADLTVVAGEVVDLRAPEEDADLKLLCADDGPARAFFIRTRS